MSFLYSPPGTITGPFTGSSYILNGTVTAPVSNEFFLPGANNPSIAVAGVVVFGLTSTLALITNTGGIEHQQTAAATGAQLLLAGGPSGVTTNRIRYTSNAAGNNLFAIRDDTTGVDRITISANGNVVHTAPSAGVSVTVNAVAGATGLVINQAAASSSSAVTINGSASVGQSLGLAIVAGTSGADSALTVKNAANTENFLTIFGDGHFTLGFSSASTAIMTANAAGAVTINAPSAGVGLTVGGSLTLAGGQLLATSAALTNNAGAQIATITNGPTAGNPTKWFPINDNGTVRNIPSW